MDTRNKNKHTQGGQILNKITKLICAGVIIGLGGLCTLGNRIDVFYEDGPTLVAEGIDGMELPQELSDPSHELWDEYDSYVDYIGIKLNFPEEIAEKCESKRWKIYDENKISELEEIVATEENFHTWCDKQDKNEYISQICLKTYIYILKEANKKNFFISYDFCHREPLRGIIQCIYDGGIVTRCMSGLYPNSPSGRYLRNFGL